MKEFLEPEMEIERFNIADIITTSGDDLDIGDLDNGIGWA